MILKQERSTDAEDVGVLLHAMFRYFEAHADRLDRSLVSVGYGKLLERANKAAEAIAELHDSEGDSWDGVVWAERLADVSDDSLAAQLASDADHDVQHVVVSWLLSFGYVQFFHGGKCWSFDAAELAEWQEDEEDEEGGFHFHSYHGLANPTFAELAHYIDHL